MRPEPNRKPVRPLDEEGLERLALFYAGRFATTRAKLAAYLSRKVRERGWAGSGPAPVERLVARFVELGYVDDRAFALSKARSLAGRGYGPRRVELALAMAGIDELNGADARGLAEAEAVEAALRFARKRSIGPYANRKPDPRERERYLAAMIRAGHAFALARTIVDLEPGEEPDLEALTAGI